MIKNLTAKRDCRGMSNDEIIEIILADRGIEDLNEFLKPSSDSLIDFDKMKGLQEAYEIVEDAIAMDEKILVFYDTDQDGLGAGTIMVRYLQKSGANVVYAINKGKKHGVKDFDLKLLDGVDTMIIVDSLNNDPNDYKRITDLKVNLIVLDHHIPTQELLESDVPFVLISSAIDNYPNPDLVGSSVVLKFCLFMDKMNLTDYADDLWVYAAMGTVADMGSLAEEENRYIVYRGLNQFNLPLVKKFIGNYMFNAESIAFSVAPLTNSCMRLAKNELAVDTFLSDDEDEIDELVKKMRECREEQNKIVDSLMDDLLMQGEEQLDKKCMFFFLGDVDAEITGLLGNKLLAIYQRPLFVVSDIGDKIAGSMRAIGVRDMMQIVNDTGLAICAGHPLAAGFFVDKDRFEDFKTEIENVLADVEFSTEFVADIEIEASQVNEQLIKTLNSLNRISGSGWPAITVLIRTNDYEVSTFSSKKHLKVVDSETGVLLTKWNDMSWQTMDNNGEFIGVGTLAAPIYGRKKFYQLTLNEYTQQND